MVDTWPLLLVPTTLIAYRGTGRYQNPGPAALAATALCMTGVLCLAASEAGSLNALLDTRTPGWTSLAKGLAIAAAASASLATTPFPHPPLRTAGRRPRPAIAVPVPNTGPERAAVLPDTHRLRRKPPERLPPLRPARPPAPRALPPHLSDLLAALRHLPAIAVRPSLAHRRPPDQPHRPLRPDLPPAPRVPGLAGPHQPHRGAELIVPGRWHRHHHRRQPRAPLSSPQLRRRTKLRSPQERPSG